MQRLLVDTSAWYALTDARDPDHGDVLAALQSYAQRLITTNFIFNETVTLLRYRLGWRPAHAFGRLCLSGQLARLIAVGAKDEDAAWQIFQTYQDKFFSYTDCVSFAVMRRLKITTAIALDQDFRSFGLHCLP